MMGSVWVGRLFGWRPPPVSVAWYGPSGDTPEGRLAELLVKCTDHSASVRLVAERSLRAELDALLPSRWPRLDEQLRSWLHLQDEARKELPVAPDSAALSLRHPPRAVHRSVHARLRAHSGTGSFPMGHDR